MEMIIFVIGLIVGTFIGILLGWFVMIHALNSEKGKELIRQAWDKEFAKRRF